MTTDKDMRDAAPHIDKAMHALDMLRYFVENKDKLSLRKRVPLYYDTLIASVLELQKVLLTDNEYTENVTLGIAEISASREYSYNITQNNQGDIFYSLDAMLPLRAMKEQVVFNRKNHNVQ
jgi:hypothetical protein